MRSSRTARFAASALAALVLGVVSGCAASPGASTPAPTSTAAPTPQPTATATQPTAAPTASPQPTSTPTSEFGAFTAEKLAAVCVDATISAFAPDVAFDVAGTRIERRLVSPEWLVLVPAQTSGHQGQAQCTIGGTPSAPELGLSSASIEQLPEEQIQNLIRGENEGGDR